MRNSDKLYLTGKGLPEAHSNSDLLTFSTLIHWQGNWEWDGMNRRLNSLDSRQGRVGEMTIDEHSWKNESTEDESIRQHFADLTARGEVIFEYLLQFKEGEQQLMRISASVLPSGASDAL